MRPRFAVALVLALLLATVSSVLEYQALRRLAHEELAAAALSTALSENQNWTVKTVWYDTPPSNPYPHHLAIFKDGRWQPATLTADDLHISTSDPSPIIVRDSGAIAGAFAKCTLTAVDSKLRVECAK